MNATAERKPRQWLARLLDSALAPGLLAVGLMLVWVVKNGGYDASTWYWGALIILAVLAGVVLRPGRPAIRVSRPAAIALAAFACYVAWSYLSITWAQSPGDALDGSNRALLYLLLFALLAILPWTADEALTVLMIFVIGVGLVAVVLLFRLAHADRVQDLIVGGRLISPTGYFNSSVALFTGDALMATALAARRGVPAPLRGLLLALATASLQVAVLGQSRGWLFTLPLVLAVTFALVRYRTRFVLAAAIPAVATLLAAHRLLDIYRYRYVPAALDDAARQGGRTALRLCGGALVIGILLAWADNRVTPPRVARGVRRAVSAVVVGAAIAAAVVGVQAATHGDPIGFMKRQWHGFTHLSNTTVTASYFGTVGSSRWDLWRVSLDALRAHPLGGLGQDNFADYYVRRAHTGEEPQWTHSIELRLLTHTGVVGFLLFAVFFVAAVVAALRARRRRDDYTAWVAGAAMLPLAVWLIHGSLDWFWEMPALSGPALGFLALTSALGRPQAREDEVRATTRSVRPRLLLPAGIAAVLAGTVVLGFPYVATSEMSAANQLRVSDPQQALNRLSTAADLNPLSALPGRLGGVIALQTGRFVEAEQRFRQSISREPGGWLAWLGDGLAASQLGDIARAQRDFEMAVSIDRRQPATVAALSRLQTKHPLSIPGAFQLLVVHH